MHTSQTKRAAPGRPFFCLAGAALAMLVVLIRPAAAEPGARHCYRPTVYRTPAGGLVLDDTDMFELQADGHYRMTRPCPPLFRPRKR